MILHTKILKLSIVFLRCVTESSTCLIDREYICNGSVICKNLTPCAAKCIDYMLCSNTQQCQLKTTCESNYSIYIILYIFIYILR